MRKLDRDASLPVVPIAVIAVVVVVLLVGLFVMYPWTTRATEYANDPNDPPDEVGDEDADPDWQGRFRIGLKVGVGTDGRCNVLRIVASRCGMTDWETYDGEPWSSASVLEALSVGKDLTIHYEVQLRNGKTFFSDEGDLEWSRGDGNEVTHETRTFFFWSEQVRDWNWIVAVNCDGISNVVERGTFGIDEDGDLVQ